MVKCGRFHTADKPSFCSLTFRPLFHSQKLKSKQQKHFPHDTIKARPKHPQKNSTSIQKLSPTFLQVITLQKQPQNTKVISKKHDSKNSLLFDTPLLFSNLISLHHCQSSGQSPPRVGQREPDGSLSHCLRVLPPH